MKIMSVSLCSLVLVSGSIGLQAEPVLVPQKAPYANDANTVLLEHFDDWTSGTPTLGVTYTNGVFGRAVHLVEGSYVQFPPPSSGAEGQTIEFWGRLDNLSQGGYRSFVQGYLGVVAQTLSISAFPYPGAGYQTQTTWVGVPETAPGLPRTSLGWHHYAMTWGKQGFHFYYDGVHVYSATNTSSPMSINTWLVGGFVGGESLDPGVFGAVDELRVSTIQRTFVSARMLEIQPIPNAVVLLWHDPTFALQAASSPSATFTNVPGATSPHTNSLAGVQKYFRLAQ